jgi:hypothetical protein
VWGTSYVKSLEYVKEFDIGYADQPLSFSGYMLSERYQFVLSVVMISQRLLLIGLAIKDERKD